MGIYEREYVRVGPRSKSGLGSLRFISVNSWIILINVLVFALDMFSSPYATPTVIDLKLNADADPRFVAIAPVIHDGMGQVVPPTVLPRVPPGTPLYQPVIDKRTRARVGTATVALMGPVQQWGHFSTALGFFHIELWRFVTFQFLHANITHLLFNMFGLWVFGGMVEQYLGSRRYAAFYLTCGIFGAVSYLALNFLGNLLPAGAAGVPSKLPLLLPDSIYTPLIGASAGVFGVLMACAFIAPNAMVMLLFPPIPLKLKWMAYGYFALAAWNLIFGGRNAGGDAAHIGGALAGAFFIRRAHLLRDFFEVLGPRRGRRVREIPRSEMDRILAKVAREGLRSLSDEEKRILHDASERMRR
jgi:membrane associated rhomboid family serine protease